MTGYGRFPTNVLIRYPTGRWGFVGSVDARLAYADTKTRAFDSKAEAIATAEALGYVWAPEGGPDGSMVAGRDAE